MAETAKNTPHGRPGHVLVVDDEHSVREFLRRALTTDHCKVTTIANGFEAVEFYRQNFRDVDLIILDMIMPEMDGWVAFKEFRRINPAAKVVVASGYAIDGVVSQCMAAGALELITKPYDLDKIRGAVKKYLASK